MAAAYSSFGAFSFWRCPANPFVSLPRLVTQAFVERLLDTLQAESQGELAFKGRVQSPGLGPREI